MIVYKHIQKTEDQANRSQISSRVSRGLRENLSQRKDMKRLRRICTEFEGQRGGVVSDTQLILEPLPNRFWVGLYTPGREMGQFC